MKGADPGLRTSYQRTPAWSVESASTVWLTTSVSYVPKFRYCSRYINRSAMASTRAAVAGCGMQFLDEPHISESNGAVGTDATRVKEDCDGFAQSAWNFQICS